MVEIYHGSNAIVQWPKVLVNGHYKDFGYGFYCTKIKKQAKRWALTKRDNSIVNQYVYIESKNLEVCTFKDMTDEWLEFVVNCRRGMSNLDHLISVANVLHSKNPMDVEDDWIKEYCIAEGDFDIAAVDPELVTKIPSAIQMGKVYQRLIFDTLQPEESEVEAIIRVYNNEICNVIDNYNCSAYYEPSYVIARAYQNGGF